jgi:hypothetical protein
MDGIVRIAADDVIASDASALGMDHFEAGRREPDSVEPVSRRPLQ